MCDDTEGKVYCDALEGWVTQNFTYEAVDKEYSTNPFNYDNFHCYPLHYNKHFVKNDIDVVSRLNSTGIIVLDKSDIDSMKSSDINTKYTVVFDKYELIYDTTSRKRVFNKEILKENNGTYYYFEGINNRECELSSTLDNGNKTFYTYHPSGKHIGITANSSNTYTHRMELITDKDNNIISYSNGSVLPYCRIIENGVVVKYHRSPVTKTGNYYSQGGRNGELQSGSPTNPTGDVTYYMYGVSKKIGFDATTSNTWTDRYRLVIDKYNNIKTNNTKIDRLGYARVVEGSNFVNYYPSPMSRGCGVYCTGFCYSVRGGGHKIMTTNGILLTSGGNVTSAGRGFYNFNGTPWGDGPWNRYETGWYAVNCTDDRSTEDLDWWLKQSSPGCGVNPLLNSGNNYSHPRGRGVGNLSLSCIRGWIKVDQYNRIIDAGQEAGVFNGTLWDTIYIFILNDIHRTITSDNRIHRTGSRVYNAASYDIYKG